MTRCDPYFNNQVVKLAEVADMERGVTGKEYSGGCTLIPLSAADYTLIRYLEQPGTVSGRFAVVIPHETVYPPYLYVAILQAAEEFFVAYQTGINLQMPILQRYFTIRYHDDPDTQKQICDQVRLVDQAIQDVTHEMELYQGMKKNMLSKMMI